MPVSEYSLITRKIAIAFNGHAASNKNTIFQCGQIMIVTLASRRFAERRLGPIVIDTTASWSRQTKS